MIGFLGGAVAVIAVLLAVRSRLIVLTVRGESMLPALDDGDRLLVVRYKRLARRGSIVAVRTAGLPEGERVDLGDDRVDLMVKRVVAAGGLPWPGRPGEVVPAGHLYLLGDSDRSLDSRTWGPVPRDRVVGGVVGRWRPRPVRAVTSITEGGDR
ncbi:MAG TPA: S26 family signal peptidase [Actinokineospora sp.]|jgi:signal peptidase I|nr:S26 family signal peptidase [Actinokineospora sp.]